jgi:hypothetical protein
MIMDTFHLIDGWYWITDNDQLGPFGSEDEAINDFVDSHAAPEE